MGKILGGGWRDVKLSLVWWRGYLVDNWGIVWVNWGRNWIGVNGAGGSKIDKCLWCFCLEGG